MTVSIEVDFLIGDYVKYAVRKCGDEGIVTGIKVSASNCILYEVAWSDKNTSWHYMIELVKS